MKTIEALGSLVVFALLSCAPMLLSYDVKLAIGNNSTQRIVNELKSKNEKYRVIAHKDSLFEIQHNFKYRGREK